MGTDYTEATKRGQQRKPSNRHPYFALEWRILDSEAYADLTFSARALLDVLGRQLGVPNNNGHLLTAYSYIKKFGFDSDRTVTRATKELIEHGFLFKTKTGGYQRGVGKFAVTWMPLSTDLNGLSPNGFKPNTWRDWRPTTKPENEKSRPTNLRSSNRKNVGLTKASTDNFAASSDDIFTDAVAVPVHGVKTPGNDYGAWVSSYLSRLAQHGPQFAASCSVSAPTDPVQSDPIRKHRQRRPLESPSCIHLETTRDRAPLRLAA